MATTSDADKSPRAANQAPPTLVAEGVSNYEIVSHYFEMSADRLGLEDDVRAVLRSNYREVQVQIPIRQTDGREYHVYSGYRVQHDNARGPFKGGLRYHPHVDQDEARSLASLMTGRPPSSTSRSAARRAGELRPEGALEAGAGAADAEVRRQDPRLHRPDKDIPAPDMGTDAQVMAWIMNEYAKFHGPRRRRHRQAGRARRLAGARPPPATASCSATARRASARAEAVRDDLRRPGLRQRRLLHRAVPAEQGAKSSASPTPTARSTPGGIDIPGFAATSPGRARSPGSRRRTSSTPTSSSASCDVLIPAALGGVFDAEKAAGVKARDGHRGRQRPHLARGRRGLPDAGIPVVPDILANAGGVIVSYFEWVQNLQHFRWDEREVNDKLGTTMRRAYREVATRAKHDDVPMRVAAFELGIEQVLDAARTRGYI